jgi:hypothetical protein
VNCSICAFASQHPPQDPAAKLTSIKAAQKFFSEDKERSFEAKVGLSHLDLRGCMATIMTRVEDDGRVQSLVGVPADARERILGQDRVLRAERRRDYQEMSPQWHDQARRQAQVGL